MENLLENIFFSRYFVYCSVPYSAAYLRIHRYILDNVVRNI